MVHSVSILGCGWLGMPLGKLLQEKGLSVKGSTTHPDKIAVLAEAGIQPFLISFQPTINADQQRSLTAFLQSELLVISLPPQVEKRGEEHHPLQIRHLMEHLERSPVQKIVYISSTSVYPEDNQVVDERQPLSGHNATGRALLQAEKQIQNSSLDWVILRCGGLMGYNRIPGKYAAGRKGVTTGDVPVNFVHLDDVTSIVYEAIQIAQWRQIYNVVAPYHPARRTIYEQNARDFGYSLPEYAPSTEARYKIVSSDKLIKQLKYSFRYPDPLLFSYTP